MAFNRSCNGALRLTRTLVLSCCALAVAGGAAFGQSSAPAANFRDARLMTVASGGERTASKADVAMPFQSNWSAPRASQISAEEPATNDSKIRQVGATVPAEKPRPIRQTQYADARATAPYAQVFDHSSLDEPYEDECPDLTKMPSILDMPYKVTLTPGPTPQGCPLPDEEYRRKAPTPITFTWKASSLCYKPLYFEDVQLERYGHYCHPFLQPFCSRVRFWLTIPCLPYLMGVNPPNECIYDLGYYRPGNCAPSMIEPIPISLRGGLLEAGAVVGLAAAIP